MLFSMVEKFLQWIERTRSRIYGVFAFWLFIGFSPVVFTSLFVDQRLIYEKTGLLKNEYIRQEYLSVGNWQGVVYVFLVLVFALGLTYLMIWQFPDWFVNKAYEKEIEAHYVRENRRLDEKDRLENRRKSLADKQLRVVEKEQVVAQKEEELEWAKEYRDFKKSTIFKKFDWLTRAVFNHYGNTSTTDEYGNPDFKVPNDILAYAKGAELVDLDVSEGKIELTKKGNFFLKNYQLEKRI